MSQIIEYIKDKKILILGYGREGISTQNYIRKHLPTKKLSIADKNYLKIDPLWQMFRQVKNIYIYVQLEFLKNLVQELKATQSVKKKKKWGVDNLSMYDLVDFSSFLRWQKDAVMKFIHLKFCFIASFHLCFKSSPFYPKLIFTTSP